MKLSLLFAMMVLYYQAQARDEVHHLRGQNRESEKDHNDEKSASNEANIGVPEKELELTKGKDEAPKNGPDAIGVPENQVVPEAGAETPTSEENQDSEGESGSENLWVRIPSWDIPGRWVGGFKLASAGWADVAVARSVIAISAISCWCRYARTVKICQAIGFVAVAVLDWEDWMSFSLFSLPYFRWDNACNGVLRVSTFQGSFKILNRPH